MGDKFRRRDRINWPFHFPQSPFFHAGEELNGKVMLSGLLIFFLLGLNFGISSLVAQPSSGIKGRVTNSSTSGPLANVNVTVIGTQWGAATDTGGYYHVKHLPPGKYSVQASIIGFETQRVDHLLLEADKDRVLDFSLVPKPLEMNPTNVEAERLWEKYQTDVSMVGVQRIRPREITSLPGAFDDPTRAVLVRSGATGAGDYNSFLTVRGSSPEQNLVVMDGVVIPNPYRFRMAMGGGMSIFDPKTIQDVHLHLGAFTAEYGNALASVLEVETRTGNLERFRLAGAVNLMDAGVMIEGPLRRGKISFLMTARRTYLDLVADRILAKSNSVYPYFYDLTNKWLFNINERNKITLSFLTSREKTKLSSVLAESVNMTEASKTLHLNLSWKRLLANGGQVQTLLSYYFDTTTFRAFAPDTSLAARLDSLGALEYENLAAENTRLSVNQTLRYKWSSQNWLNCGVSAAVAKSSINFRSSESNFYFARNDIPRDIRFDESQRFYAAYLENTSELSEKVQMRLGLRYDYSTLYKEGELSHRLSVLYKLDAATTIEGAWGDFYQFPDPLTLSIRDQPLEIGANREVITAEKATHKVASFKRKLNTALSASLEFYHLDIDRLLVTEDRETFEPFNQGRGVLQGIELVLEKRPPGLEGISGLISYSYGSSRYHNIRDKNHEWIPFNYDRRHALTVWYNQSLGKHWRLSLLWRYAAGLPYTDVLGIRITEYARGESNWDFIRGQRNARRFPAYQRLDLRLSYQVRSGERSFLFYLDLINVYNHKNVYNLVWAKVPVQQGATIVRVAERRTLYMLPFLPTVGLQFGL